MSQKNSAETERIDRNVAAAERERKLREKGYREKALKIHPWICARCGREFSGKKVRDLTVHHKDHNHDNNPADGSNWELLCIYCHDNEHCRNAVAAACGALRPGEDEQIKASQTPFAQLANLLNTKK